MGLRVGMIGMQVMRMNFLGFRVMLFARCHTGDSR